eukprot:gb/GECG01012743.1/.p1 GENE.gb/GECG01012743.1/~~gb/GECG01012743.1/.p1  ORF type:complete len:273 (+),score=30.71 gb/GECG01012743.1/:1-819(+)
MSSTMSMSKDGVPPTGGGKSEHHGIDQEELPEEEDNFALQSTQITHVPDSFTIPFEPPTEKPWEGREEAPTFYEWRTTFPFLRELLKHKHVILDELKYIEKTSWPDWPEHNLYDDDGDEWKVFPLVHTFPAYDPSQTRWINQFCDKVPNTVRLLKALPGIRTALFSRLGPNTELSPHRGWGDLSNYVLRCHLPLRLPSVGHCGVLVEDDEQQHHNHEVIVFDDSQTHSAFNDDEKESRVVLIFDLLRPQGLPGGTAEGGTTEELESFMEYFK